MQPFSVSARWHHHRLCRCFTPPNEDSGRSNRLILLAGIAWVALVLVNWGMSFFVV